MVVKSRKIAHFAGLRFKGVNRDHVLTQLNGECKFIVTVNANFIVRANEGDSRLRGIINNNVSTFDGFWPWFLARVYLREFSIEKISGSELIYDLWDLCIKNKRNLFIVGGSAIAASNQLNRTVEDNFAVGWEAPFEEYPFSTAFEAKFTSLIVKYRPMVVVICLGSPKQEFLIEDHLKFLQENGVSFAYGAGGTADMISGKFRRAPNFLVSIGLEGVWRVIQEPRRLIARFITDLRFFLYIFK
jgi:N-acetylglucosaminyldiphosphoundecaprenol N-acetyl-beta-D-mannosaminyltransferase